MSRTPDLTVVPGELVLLSQTCMSSAQHLDDAWRATEAGVQMQRGAAGDVTAGPRMLDDHAVCVESAATTLGYLANVLEIDMDLLQQVAFDFSGADENAATVLNAQAQQTGQVASGPVVVAGA